MTAKSALLAGRQAAERVMLDACRVSVVVGRDEDPESGAVTPVLEQVYEGRCKVQTFEPYEREPEVAGASVTVQRYSVHVPVGSFRPEVGHVVEVVTAALDPHLAGRSFRVVALLHKTAATAYRLGVEEVG